MIADERWRRRLRSAPVVLVALVASAVLSAGCVSIPRPDAVSPLAPPTTEESLDLTIVHSNDTWGYLTPCG
jgi:2',3'-cyclic-nucleotide 2'-phosphodiesterase (5'-nucleotidase family)